MQVFNVGYINFGNTEGEFIGVERLDNGQFLINQVSEQSKPGKLRVYGTNRQGDRTKLIEVTDYDPRSEVWYTESVKAGKPVWSPVYQWEDNPEVFSVSSSYPVRDKNNQIIGVIGVDLILTQVDNFLGQLKIGQSGKVFILERNGLLVANSGNSKPFQVIQGKASRLKASESYDPTIQATSQSLTRQFDDLNRIQDSQQFSFDIGHQRQLVKITPWKDQLGLDWLIVVVVPEADFMGQINANARTTILLCLITFAVATAVGVLTARWISGQIFKLNQASQAIAGGELNQNVKVNGIIEIEKLAGSFNSMAHQLEESFAALEAKNEALRIAKENYRDIYENALEGIFQSSPDGRYISVNPAMARIYGYTSPDQMIASVTQIATQTYVNPDNQNEFKHLMEEQGEVKHLEYQAYRQDGNIIWIEESTRGVRDSSGQLLYYEGIVQDITQRKRLEAGLKQQLQELQIEIDQQKREREVAQITQSDYFQELQAEAEALQSDDDW